MFELYGKVKNVRLSRYADDKKSRKLAFIEMSSETEADAAMKAFDGLVVEGQPLSLEITSGNGKDSKTSKTTLLFPHLSSDVVDKIQLDDVAEFSVSDQNHADMLTELILSMIDQPNQTIAELHSPLTRPNNNDNTVTATSRFVFTDGCACAGGNVISFAKSPSISVVHAVEYDESRFHMLVNNISLLGGKPYSVKSDLIHSDDTLSSLLPRLISEDNSTSPTTLPVVSLLDNAPVVCYLGSYVEFINILKQDVLFFDPPWGGVNYKKEESLKMYLGSTEISDLLIECRNAAPETRCLVLKSPNNFDDANMLNTIGDPTKYPAYTQIYSQYIALRDSIDTQQRKARQSRKQVERQIPVESSLPSLAQDENETVCCVSKTALEYRAEEKQLQLARERLHVRFLICLRALIPIVSRFRSGMLTYYIALYEDRFFMNILNEFAPHIFAKFAPKSIELRYPITHSSFLTYTNDEFCRALIEYLKWDANLTSATENQSGISHKASHIALPQDENAEEIDNLKSWDEAFALSGSPLGQPDSRDLSFIAFVKQHLRQAEESISGLALQAHNMHSAKEVKLLSISRSPFAPAFLAEVDLLGSTFSRLYFELFGTVPEGLKVKNEERKQAFKAALSSSPQKFSDFNMWKVVISQNKAMTLSDFKRLYCRQNTVEPPRKRSDRDRSKSPGKYRSRKSRSTSRSPSSGRDLSQYVIKKAKTREKRSMSRDRDENY